jgi:hypothetical protein
MGLDDPADLMPQMIKRRTSNGLLKPVASFVEPLIANELVDKKEASEPWQHWWDQSSANSFYVYDNLIASTKTNI